MVFKILFILLVGMLIGAIINNLYNGYIDKKKVDAITHKADSIYLKILNEIKLEKSVFISRVNNFLTIQVDIDELDGISYLYVSIDKKEISIFKNEACIYTSHNVSGKIIDDIYAEISRLYLDYINNVFTLQTSIIVDEMTYNNALNAYNKPKKTRRKSTEYKLDDILDKINSVGYNNLTAGEKKYLDSYGK